MSQIGSSKRKLFDESDYGDGRGKKPRLQVTIPRLRLSQKQLESLRKISSKHQKAPLTANKEEDKEHVAIVNASASPSASTTETVSTKTIPTETIATETVSTKTVPTETVPTETVPTETVSTEAVLTEAVSTATVSTETVPTEAVLTATVSTETVSTVVKEPVATLEESPIRHRLTNLLDGTSLSPDGAAHTNEENVKSINCEEGGQLNDAESLSGPVSTEEYLFRSEELISDNGLSPLTHEEVCITVPCYPDVVSKTCMQVEIGYTRRLPDNDSQAAGVVTASVQDKEDHETNQGLEPSSVEERSSVSEEGNELGSVSPHRCDVLHQLSNDAVPDEKEAENGNAEEGRGVMSRSPEGRAADSMIDYSSHYNTLEAVNTLLTKFTEEKRARTELEELVSHLEEKNKGLHSECEKLKDLVNDLLPSSKVKNETVSRGIQINMDLSLRRGRTVDRATSPLRTIREPSPDLTILSFSTGCQTVDLSNEMKSTACQTDPPLDARLLATCTAQSAAPTRVQGIVVPNVQGRAPVQVPNYTRVSNPVQMSYSQTPLQQQSAKVTVSQPLGIQSQQAHTSWQMLAYKLANMGQTTGYNNVVSPHATTLNSPQVRISQPTGAALYAQVPQNQFIPTSTQMSGNQTLVGSAQGSYSGVYQTYSTLSTQQATRPDTLYQSTGQRLNLNTATLSPLFTQNQLLAQSSASLSHQTFPSAQSSTSHNSRPAQFVGALQHCTRQQTTPTSSLQISGNAKSSVRDVILHLANGMRRQITTSKAESLIHPQQQVGASLPSRMVYNQVTAPQHREGLSLQHRASPTIGSQVQQLTSIRNSQQSLGAFPQSRVGYNQGTVPQQTGGVRTQHHVPQPEGSQAMPHTQTSSTSSRNSQQPLGTFPRRRVGYDQVAAPQQTEGLQNQHQVSQPEASQAHLHAQPVQQNDVNRKTGQQSDQTPLSSRTSNTDNHLADRLLENVLERRSLYSEVQLVYNELQKNLSEGKYSQKQSTTTQKPRSLDHQLSQLPTSKSMPPINKQPPDATPSTNSVSSVSEQSSLYHHTSANQLPIQVSPSECLKNGTQKRLLHFSQEADSNIPGTSPGDADGSRRLGSSAVRPTVGKDQRSSRQGTSCRLSIDNDPYKLPPKTPSGALEDVVKKLLTLQNEIARTDNVSGTARVSSNSLAESTDSTSKADSTTESHGAKQMSGLSESTTSCEKDSSNESLLHYSRNPECKSTESVSLNQGADTQGLSKNQHDNNCCSSGNQDKATEDTSVSPSSHSVLNTDFDKMQTESEPPSSVRGGKGNATEKEIADFPATEGEEQESDDGDGQDNSVRERKDSSSPCPSGLAKGTENREPQDSDDIENDNSSQDIYAGLMSPIIPRMAAARRARSLSDMHTTEDTCDVDMSTSSINSPVKNVNSEDHNVEFDPEPKQTSDDQEQGFKDSQQECVRTCATVPSADADCNQHQHDTASNSEQENAVNDQEHAPLSSDVIMEEMQLEEDAQVSSTGGIVTDLSNAQQATCNTKIQEQLSTELSEGQRDSPASVPVLNSNVKLEASDGPCMGGVAQGNNKERKDEQYQKCQLNPKAIPEQNFVCLYSTSQETPIVGDFKETKKASFPFPLPSSSLLKENVDEKGVSPDSVDSRTNIEFNNRNTAINNEPSPPLNTSSLPDPRLALRIMNGNTLIMWDLPPDNNITDISVFEVFVFLRNKDGRWQNHTGRWIKVGEMKAMPLPMACTLRQVIQKDVMYSFIVRAVGKNGLPGPFSKPCCVSIS